MSAPTFNGVAIFGAQTKQTGPMSNYRRQLETLPGVAGGRTYRMGCENVTWRVRGRVTTTTRALLETFILAALALKNGQCYTFVSAAGNSYASCELTSYAPLGEPQCVKSLSGGSSYTVEVDGTVEWRAPTI